MRIYIAYTWLSGIFRTRSTHFGAPPYNLHRAVRIWLILILQPPLRRGGSIPLSRSPYRCTFCKSDLGTKLWCILVYNQIQTEYAYALSLLHHFRKTGTASNQALSSTSIPGLSSTPPRHQPTDVSPVIVFVRISTVQPSMTSHWSYMFSSISQHLRPSLSLRCFSSSKKPSSSSWSRLHSPHSKS